MRLLFVVACCCLFSTKLFCQNSSTSLGFNLVGPAELFDFHTQFRLKNYHHYLMVGATWKPTSTKFAVRDDINYLVFPVQYQYHFYLKRKIHIDVNAGLQLQYNVSTYLPNHLKITPTLGLSGTKTFKTNCYYLRAGAVLFVPTYLSVDKFETFGYTLNRWLFWPQLGVGKYLN